MTNYFEGEPDFEDNQGTKWWINEKFTKQARDNGLKGSCWEVKFDDGYRELCFLSQEGEILKTTQKPPTMHDWIKMQNLK